MDITPSSLRDLVLSKIREIGDVPAQSYFDVSAGTISAWKNGKTSPSLAAAQKCWDESLACDTPEIWGQGQNAPVQILLPIYKEPDPLNHITLFINYKKYGYEKVNVIPRLRTLIDEARNDLVAKALLTTAKKFVFVDADMILPIGNAAGLRKHGWNIPEKKGARVALQRIMSWPDEHRIVGALYRDRKTGTHAQCERGFRSPQENARLLDIISGKNTTDDGLEENGWVGFGMVRIDRSVFEEMAAEAKPGGKLADIAPPPEHGNRPLGFFGRSSQWRGEDVALCRRAGMLGIKTYCDVGLVCGHRGNFIF